MPYTPDNVPGHVPAELAAQWAGAWNGAYAQCQEDGGGEADCEQKAFAVANALLDKENAMDVNLYTLGEEERFAGSPRNPFGTHSSYQFKDGQEGYRRAWRLHFSQIGNGALTANAMGPIRGTVRRCAMIAAAMKPPCQLVDSESVEPRAEPKSPLDGEYPQKPGDYGLDRWKEPEDEDDREGMKLSCTDLNAIKRAAMAEIKRRIADREKQEEKERNGAGCEACGPRVQEEASRRQGDAPVSGVRVFRREDGRPWWIGWSASAYVALDGWIIAAEALEDDARREGDRGALDLWHEKPLTIGTARYAYLAGRILVEVGDFNDTPAARAFIRYAESLEVDEDLGMSIAWDVPDRDTIDYEERVFYQVQIDRRAVLPKDVAADYTTAFGLREVRTVDLKDWLKKIAGFAESEEDRKAIEESIETAQHASAALDELGVPARARRSASEEYPDAVQLRFVDAPADESKTPPDAQPSSETPPAETPEPARALDASDVATMLQEMAGSLAGMLQAEIDKMAKQIEKLGAATEETGRAALALGQKVAEVEGRLDDQSAMRKAFMEALTRRASNAPETALNLAKGEDKDLANGRVGVVDYPWSPQKR